MVTLLPLSPVVAATPGAPSPTTGASLSADHFRTVDGIVYRIRGVEYLGHKIVSVDWDSYRGMANGLARGPYNMGTTTEMGWALMRAQAYADLHHQYVKDHPEFSRQLKNAARRAKRRQSIAAE